MEAKKNWQDLLVITIAIAPVIYLITIWNSIPAIIPTHYNADFKPNAIGSKSILWFPALLLSGVSLLIYFLFKNIHRIDPKRYGDKRKDSLMRLGIVVLVFMAILNFVILLSITKNIHLLDKLLFPVVGLFFSFIGNYMQNLKPNYFAGIRIPWTLNSEQNWRKTHQFAGKLWFFGGLTIAVGCLFLPLLTAAICMSVVTLALVIAPMRYSYLIFKQEKQIK